MTTQIITLSTPNPQLTSEDQFLITVNYNTDTADNTLSGIGLRIHFDSSELQFIGTDSLFSTSIFGSVTDVTEDVDDGDANTDRYITLRYADFLAANWPNTDLPQELAQLRFAALPDYDGSQVNVTFSSTATGYTGQSAPLVLTAPSGPAQIIDLSTSDSTLTVGQEFVVTVNYDTDSADNTLSGIGLRIHFDSSELQFIGTDSLFEPSIFGSVTDVTEDVDDGDANTDRYITLRYADFLAANWPNTDLPQELAQLRFEALPDYDGSELNVTFSSTATGYTGQATPLTLNVNEAPVITSNTEFSVEENIAAVGTIVATDADAADVLTYSISGGDDADLFAIDGATGELSFIAAPDFEAPADAGADNVYNLQVSVTDGFEAVTQDLTVTVTDVPENQAPVITSDAEFSVEENIAAVGTIAATDVDGDTLTYSISGVDAALFAIDAATGVLSFVAGPDFEVPADTGADNVYNLEVSVTDGFEAITQDLTVTVTDVNEAAPVITSDTEFSVEENTTAVGTIVASDADTADVLTYSISGGDDADLFAIDPATGELSFVIAPDFEDPADTGADNVYNLEVSVTDGTNSGTQDLAVTVTDVPENQAPVITSDAEFSVEENIAAVGTIVATDVDGDTLTYSISGDDVALFAIDAATGVLSFVAGPDFEVPADAGADNVYNLQVSVTDGFEAVTQDLTVTVTDVDEVAPVVTPDQTFTYAENQAADFAIGTVVATDEVGVTAYAIVSGNDDGFFAIDTATGALTLTEAGVAAAANDFEVEPNTFTLGITATDEVGNVSDVTDVTIAVSDVDEVPPIEVTIAASDANADEEGLDPGEFTITLSEAAPEGGLTVSYSVSGTAATDGSDYTALPGTVTIAAGETTATIALTPLDDDVQEPGDNETVVVTLTDAEAYDLGESNEATVTIADNDAPAQIIQLSTPDAELGVDEEFVVTVSYDVTDADNTLTGIGVRVHYDSTELAFNTSSVLVGSLFAPVNSGLEDVDDGDADTDSQITFAYTDFAGTFPNVEIPADLLTLTFTTLEGFDGSNLNVTFSALASGYSGQADPLALALQVDLPVVTIAATADALEEGLVAGQFTVTLDAALAEDLVVNYEIAGTATDTDDYAPLTGQVTILAGETTALIDVTPEDDALVEGAETVIVTLTDADAYDLGATAEATVTIADNDAVVVTPTVTIAATDNAASEQGDNPGQFTVTLSEAPTADLELTYTVAATSTATAGDDYTALTGTVTVLAGATTATIAVIPVEDAETEGTESVIVTLTDGDAYDLGAVTEAEVTIADSVITDIDGNTNINGADIALLNQFLLLPSSALLQATFDQFPSLTEGASNLTGDALNAAIQEQLSLFDIDGNGETTGGDIFLINTYILGASDPNIEAILEATAANLSSELTGPNTTGAGLNTTLSALFV